MKPIRWISATPTHSEIELAIMQLMEYKGYHIRRTHTGRYHPAHKGILDLVAGKKDRCVWIEVKVGGDTLTEEQEKEVAELRAKDIQVIIARGLDDVIGKV